MQNARARGAALSIRGSNTTPAEPKEERPRACESKYNAARSEGSLLSRLITHLVPGTRTLRLYIFTKKKKEKKKKRKRREKTFLLLRHLLRVPRRFLP